MTLPTFAPLLRLTVCCLAIALAGASANVSADPVRLSLDGPWQLHEAKPNADVIAATVPGVVQTDLLAAGTIADPFDQDNARQQEWIDQAKWVYARTFTLPAELRSRERVILRFEGLDTIAALDLNGHALAPTDNMFRTFEYDVKALLRDGDNRLTVTFSPLEPYIAAFKQAAPKVDNATGPDVANVRKSPFMNGWDFCSRERTCGIYKHVELLGYDDARLRGARIEAILDSDDAAAKLRVRPLFDGVATSATVTITLDQKPVASATMDLSKTPSTEINIPDPQLWWPRGMGDQPLYDVSVELLDGAKKTIDRTTRRVGLRTIALRPKNGDKPLQLLVNGRPFFAKGASWVPPDQFLPRVTTARTRQLVQDAADANMNMLRTWGGGAYEDDAFFDACDELGILVWFDFKFACSVYPGGNPAFADNVRHEIDDQVLRVGSHPSIAVWSGNNECLGAVTGFKMLSQADYDAFYQGQIGKQLTSLLPTATFVDGSPGPAGDEHNWWVWHVGADFEKYRESHGFMSEFGFQSFPHPATVDSYTRPTNRTDTLTPIMKAHQHNGNGKGNEMIRDVTARYFRPAKDFESTLWLSQINQAYGMEMGVDHWRGDWPRSSGALVWQLDDCYPGPSWSLIDYYGRRKAAWYAMRRAMAPVAIDAVVDETARQVRIRLASDLREPTKATLRWTITDTDGKPIESGPATRLTLEAGTNAIDGPTVDWPQHADGRSRRIVWIEVSAGDRSLATKTVTLTRPKDVELRDPSLQATVAPTDNGAYVVTIHADRPALWAWIDLPSDPDARFDDNFIDIAAGGSTVIRVTPSKPTTADELRARVRVRSLYDTADHAATARP